MHFCMIIKRIVTKVIKFGTPAWYSLRHPDVGYNFWSMDQSSWSQACVGCTLWLIAALIQSDVWSVCVACRWRWLIWISVPCCITTANCEKQSWATCMHCSCNQVMTSHVLTCTNCALDYSDYNFIVFVVSINDIILAAAACVERDLSNINIMRRVVKCSSD